MSAPVNVLAVMDQTSRVLRRNLVGMPRDVEAARAAVAELIEAVNSAAFNATSLRLNDHQTCIRVKPEYWASILSALARVKGGAA